MRRTGGSKTKQLQVSQEFRNIFFSVEAVWRLPRSTRTEYRDNSLRSAMLALDPKP